jgi:hypothetical protein
MAGRALGHHKLVPVNAAFLLKRAREARPPRSIKRDSKKGRTTTRGPWALRGLDCARASRVLIGRQKGGDWAIMKENASRRKEQ